MYPWWGGGGDYSHIEETRALVIGEYNVKLKMRPLWGWLCRLQLLISNGGHAGTE